MIVKHIDGQVLHITIDRIDRKNALTPAMYQTMAIALEEVIDSKAKVVVIEGKGGIFTSGNDITEFTKLSQSNNMQVEEVYRFMKALLHCPLPVIAKVEGLAIGIGSTLLLHCDFVYASIDAKFSMPFINLGLVPEYASSYLLPRISSRLNANKVLMLGETFDAKQAIEYGLVSDIFSDDLNHATAQLAQSLCKKPLFSLIQTKRLLNYQIDEVERRIDSELEVFAKALQSDAAKEAFAAFNDKREINYDVYK